MKQRILKVENYPDNCIFLEYGKQKQMIKIDCVSLLSEFLGVSKSEVKRVIKQGGLSVHIPPA